MTILHTSDGKMILVGGRFLSASPVVVVSAPTQSLTVTDYHTENPIAEPVFQRKAGTEVQPDGGYADVPVLFSYTGGAPVSPQARVVAANGGAVILDWTALTGVQVNDASKTGLSTLPGVPIGCKYLLQMRDTAQPSITITNGTRKWGVGVVIVVAGQSNMVGTLSGGGVYNEAIPGMGVGETEFFADSRSAQTYFSISGFTTSYTTTGAGGQGTLGGSVDSGSTGAAAFVRLVSQGLSAKYGKKVPVCAAIWAWGDTGLGEMMLPSGTTKAVVYSNTGTTSNNIGWKSPLGYTPGDFEGIVLHQGEKEAGAITRPTRTQALSDYYNFMLGMVVGHGRTASNLFFLPAVLGLYGDNGVVNCPDIENVRGAVYDLAGPTSTANGWTRVHPGWNCIDLDPASADGGNQGLHFVGTAARPYQKWSNRRMAQAVLKELGCTTFSGMGPKITSVVRAGDVATVTVAHEGGSTLVARNSANQLSGWYANTAADFSGTDIVVTATIASGTTVTVTFPAGTQYPCYLKYMGGKPGTYQSTHPDVTNPLYDDAKYPAGADSREQFTGLPLQPTPDAIKVT